jgi:tRNA-dihydrouridine synthase B
LNWQTLIIHGRTYQEGFSGPIDLELIKKIKQMFPSRTIIANGGIGSPEDAAQVLEKTKADGAAIARGCLGNPWIFKNIKQYLETGKYSNPTKDEIKQVALLHIEYFVEYKGEEFFQEMRKHLGWYFKGIPGAKEIRKEIYTVENSKQAISLIKKIH